MDHEDKKLSNENQELSGVSTRTLRAADEASDGQAGKATLALHFGAQCFRDVLFFKGKTDAEVLAELAA